MIKTIDDCGLAELLFHISEKSSTSFKPLSNHLNLKSKNLDEFSPRAAESAPEGVEAEGSSKNLGGISRPIITVNIYRETRSLSTVAINPQKVNAAIESENTRLNGTFMEKAAIIPPFSLNPNNLKQFQSN